MAHAKEGGGYALLCYAYAMGPFESPPPFLCQPHGMRSNEKKIFKQTMDCRRPLGFRPLVGAISRHKGNG